MTGRVPDLLVEQLLLGELDEDDAQQVRAQLEADEDPRLQQLETSNAAILDAHPPQAIARQIEARLGAAAARRRWSLWSTAATLAVAAGALLLWKLAGPSETPRRPEGPVIARADSSADPSAGGVRIKGDAAIIIERKVGTTAQPLLARAEVTPGDTLQISYRSGGWKHGVLVSLDGAGEVTLHFPAETTESTRLQDDGVAVLHAFELDDAPEFERFMFFTANAPLDPQAVLARVRALPRSATPAGRPLDPAPAEALVELPLIRTSGADPGPI